MDRMTVVTPDEHVVLLNHIEELEKQVEDLKAKLDFANAELRQIKAQKGEHSVSAAPDDYDGPRGNSGQRIMTQQQAWDLATEQARIAEQERRQRLGIK